MSKLNTPKGTRDFLPNQVLKRNYIFDIIKEVFIKYGYLEIETPSMENISTLMGKYGEEGDRLIFKIINSGDYLKKSNKDHFERGESNKFTLSISDKALRYDLTVPFARFVVQNFNELVFPFKRFQIQPVWRADRPQKGRYREFYQCDVDVVGSDSLLYEIEFIQIFDEVLSNLQISNFSIKVNNRKILAGIVEIMDEKDKLTEITVSIDKLDKIGKDGVINELKEKGISKSAIQKINPLFENYISNSELLISLSLLLSDSEIGLKGIEELKFVVENVSKLGLKSAKIEIDPMLARGLNYYTGAIFEVKANDVNIGSICGGGRYDDLTGIFGQKGLSGVGISFGADRIYDVLDELNLFPVKLDNNHDFLFMNFGEKEQIECLKLLKELRSASINSDIYPKPLKMKKQMSFANQKGYRFVGLYGEEEINSGVVLIKNMENGEQDRIEVRKVVEYLENKLIN